MRLRKKPWADEELNTNDRLIKNPEQCKGKWKEIFGQ